MVWDGKFANDMRNDEVNRPHLNVMDPNSSLYGQRVTADMLTEPAMLMRTCSKISLLDGWGLDWTSFWGGQPYVMEYGRDFYIARSAETYLLLAAELRNGNIVKL